MRQAVGAMAALALASAAWADEGIVTDRPDFTEGATAVGLRTVQLEGGLTLARAPGARAISGPEALLRVGVAPKIEARLGLPDLNRARMGDQRARGLGDFYAGVKVQLGPIGGVDLSVIPALSVPTGDRDFSSRAVDPEIKLCAGRELGGAFSLSGMVFVADPTDPETRRRDTTTQLTLSLGQSVSARADVFYELVNTDPRFGSSERLFHTGVAWRPSPDRQWDLHGGCDLAGFSRNAFLGLGYARKW